MRRIDAVELGFERACSMLRRPEGERLASAQKIAAEIIEEVRARGDAALLALSRRFDCDSLQTIEVEQSAWQRAENDVLPGVKSALQKAAERIRDFHLSQAARSWMNAAPERITGQLVRPLRQVGVYVPGGAAAYPSSVLMTVIPARCAGVEQVVMCTPAQSNGTVMPAVLYAAMLAGVDRLFCVGGAQAIAAMALGTETIPPVDKIVGPGNIYVNAAKKMLWGTVDIDMIAGPSEVCVVADETANPAYAAWDLMTQTEHDADSAAFLLTPSSSLADAVEAQIAKSLSALPRRQTIQAALEGNSAIVKCADLQQAIELANCCAPEHLTLMVKEPLAHLARVRNAGAVLLGEYAPQTLGDYLAGPSHTLPTGGAARFASPLNVETFLKRTSVLYSSADSLAEDAPYLIDLARAEGFEAHAAAVEARLAGCSIAGGTTANEESAE